MRRKRINLKQKPLLVFSVKVNDDRRVRETVNAPKSKAKAKLEALFAS